MGQNLVVVTASKFAGSIAFFEPKIDQSVNLPITATATSAYHIEVWEALPFL
jgi:hypothetical protein